jgi:hypothetical protein
MNKEDTIQWPSFSFSNIRHYFYLFMIWPFLAFILAIKNYNKKEAKTVVYLFLIYYGLTFVNSNEAVDAYRYALTLKANANLPFSDIFKIVGGIYSSGTSMDIIEPLVSFIVSRFTSDFHIYFAVWSAIFGFFYLKSVNLLYDRYGKNPGMNITIIMTFFICILPITSITGVRMWTAAWIFFYSAYHVVLYRNWRYLILAVAASFLHWSFFTANVILLIYYFAGNRNFIYLPLAIVSFILPYLIAPAFRSMSMLMGGSFQDRYEGYSSENYISAQQESMAQSSWFMQISNNLILYFLLFSVVYIQLRHRKLMQEESEKNLFSFLLLFLAFVNFGKAIPSFGGRFQIVFFLFATLYIFMYIVKLTDRKLNLLNLLGLFPIALYVAINFRMGAESINAFIFAPGFGLPLFLKNFSLAGILFH